ncbi:Uncharacterised protein [Mycobacteroides abscessus subsp. massiliense]|nr:Uncharacterised protein [Mycobacteroides abscessus subsp. massiliense]
MGRGDRELDHKQCQQCPRRSAVKSQGENQCHAHHGLRCGQQRFLNLTGIEDQRESATARKMGERQRADQQCPLVDLGRDQCRDGCGALAARGENRGDDELGCLRCQRCEPLHQQELVDTQLRSGTHQTVGERLGAQQNDRGGKDEHRDDRAAAQVLGQHAYRRGGAHQIRFFGLAPADGEQIKAEPREQRDAEREMNLAACRDHKRHHAGHRQEPEFDAVGRLQGKQIDRAAGRLAGHCQCEENDDRPSEAHQQTVRPGHVRRCVLGVLGYVAGDVGVVKVDGILG